MSEIRYRDQLNRELVLQSTPKRIVSLVPSQTELLFDLGLDEEVVGITKFCIHPSEWRNLKTRVGGTKSIHVKNIIDLNPDLIIANKEENDRDSILQMTEHFPVWVSDVRTLADAYSMIKSIGEITGKSIKSNAISSSIAREFEILKVNRKYRALYLIWNDPFMSVNSDTFIHEMMLKSGFLNVVSDFDHRYPELKDADLIRLNPELVLLSSEPFPFKQKHVDQIQSLLPKSKIILVDGEMFSWYGSRLLKTPAYINELHKNIELLTS